MSKSIYKIKFRLKTLFKSRKCLKAKEFSRQKMIKVYKTKQIRPQKRTLWVKLIYSDRKVEKKYKNIKICA